MFSIKYPELFALLMQDSGILELFKYPRDRFTTRVGQTGSFTL
jgi:hypothetical protein